MAIIRCKECGCEISDKAPVCVNCGYYNISVPIKKIKSIYGIMLLFLAIPLSLIYFILFGVLFLYSLG